MVKKYIVRMLGDGLAQRFETVLQVDASVLIEALPCSNERVRLRRSLAG